MPLTRPDITVKAVAIPILDNGLSTSIIGPVMTILLQVAVAIVLAITSTHDLYFYGIDNTDSTSTQLPSSIQFIYTTSITILATLISTFTVGQIKCLWVSRRYSVLADNLQATVPQRRQFGIMIGLATLKDKFKDLHLTVSFAVASLITTGIVAGLNPTPFDVTTPFTSSLYVSRNMETDYCYTQRTNLTSISSDWFTWKTGNTTLSIQGGAFPQNATAVEPEGSETEISRNVRGKCETRWILPTLATSTGSDYDSAYTLGATSIENSARGVPFDAYYNTFAETFRGRDYTRFSPNDQKSSICLPVLVKTPASCQWVTDRTTPTLNNTGLTVNINNCTIQSPSLQVNPWWMSGAAVAGACTAGHDIGTATIVFGTSGLFNDMLIAMMGEDSPYASAAAVGCSIDIRTAVGFRLVTIERVVSSQKADASENIDEGSSIFRIFGDTQSLCVPRDKNGNILKISDFLPDTALATAAAASWQLLAENRLVDGYLETLMNIAEGPTGGLLEDILWTASGIALSMYWGRSQARDVLTPIEIGGGVRTQTLIRVGPGQLWALIYCIPSIFSCWLLLYLLWNFPLYSHVEETASD